MADSWRTLRLAGARRVDHTTAAGMCVKFQKEAARPRLDSVARPARPAHLRNVSKDAWKLWEERMKDDPQTSTADAVAEGSADLVAKHMEDFFFGDGAALPPGYVPSRPSRPATAVIRYFLPALL